MKKVFGSLSLFGMLLSLVAPISAAQRSRVRPLTASQRSERDALRAYRRQPRNPRMRAVPVATVEAEGPTVTVGGKTYSGLWAFRWMERIKSYRFRQNILRVLRLGKKPSEQEIPVLEKWKWNQPLNETDRMTWISYRDAAVVQTGVLVAIVTVILGFLTREGLKLRQKSKGDPAASAAVTAARGSAPVRTSPMYSGGSRTGDNPMYVGPGTADAGRAGALPPHSFLGRESMRSLAAGGASRAAAGATTLGAGAGAAASLSAGVDDRDDLDGVDDEGEGSASAARAEEAQLPVGAEVSQYLGGRGEYINIGWNDADDGYMLVPLRFLTENLPVVFGAQAGALYPTGRVYPANGDIVQAAKRYYKKSGRPLT